jgi:hypothetical protein
VPTIGANFLSLAEQAVKESHSHIRYLEALLAIECEERDRHAIGNRIRDAQLPRMKTLEEFDFAQAPKISAARIRELAEGGYIERSEPIVLIGECGTGKSHLATGLCLAACRQKRRVRFTTAAALVVGILYFRHLTSTYHGCPRFSLFPVFGSSGSMSSWAGESGSAPVVPVRYCSTRLSPRVMRGPGISPLNKVGATISGATRTTILKTRKDTGRKHNDRRTVSRMFEIQSKMNAIAMLSIHKERAYVTET